MKRTGKVILIVEDEPHVRDLIKIILEMEGFEILLASNGKEALDIIHKNPPHLVITDIMMPEMDGIQLFLTLRDSEETSSIPVVMLTVKSQMEDIKSASLLGVDAYLTKPFDPRELIGIVREKLNI